ncbi:MAG: IS4 family transposase, partial [Microcoleaceae cyanobacterium]
YQNRWSIETMFKHCKTGGYNLEQTRVNSTRLLALFLLMTFAYALSILEADSLLKPYHFSYVTSIHKGKQPFPHHSDFTLGLLALAWMNSMALWLEIALTLMALKPHKRLHFQRGLNALSSIQQASQLSCHP